MLKMDINQASEGADLEIEGTVYDTIREVMLTVGLIYGSLAEQSEEAAETFREHVARFAMDDGFWAVAKDLTKSPSA